MNIVFHAHHADMPEPLRQRAEHAVRKLATRLRRVVDAVVRFSEDGPTRRVEIVLRPPRRDPLVAVGSGRQYETALGEALGRMESHVEHLRVARGKRIRTARALSRDGVAPFVAPEPADAGADDEAAPDAGRA